MPDSKLEISIPGEWLIKKLLGPTADDIGADFSKLYQAGRNKILNAAHRKVKDLEDGAKTNLRVTRDVFWNGSFTESDICAEYYGGALASSRSNDGQDDSSIFYLNIIQSLSSTQLHLHYAIYNSLNKLLVRDESELNVGQESELAKNHLYLSSIELTHTLKLPIERDLVALYQAGLVRRYTMDSKKTEDKQVLPYTMIVPTTLGIQMYAMSQNKLIDFKKFPKAVFEDFPEIALVEHFSLDLEKLMDKI